MALDKFHLSKKGDEWRLEKAGTNRARVTAATKAEAIKKTSAYMQKNEGSVRIHKVNGRIQEERTYRKRK